MRFIKIYMDTPFIPTWSRVKSAIPDFLERLFQAVNEVDALIFYLIILKYY